MLLPYTSYKRKGPRGQRLVNCHSEKASPDQAQPLWLIGDGGLKNWKTVADTNPRGAIRHANRVYAVCGSNLYRIDDSGSTSIGVIRGGGRVSMATNGQELCIVTSTLGYIVSNDVITQITDSTYTGYNVKSVTEMDGFFIFAASGNIHFKSRLYDGLNYDAEDYDLASKYSDDLVAVYASEMTLIMGGVETTEFWYNAGASPYPYQRVPNGVVPVGLLAKHSYAKDELGTYFLAHDHTVRRIPLGSVEPIRISHHGIEELISNYAVKDDAWGFCTHAQDGASMYHLLFPTEGACWVFDSTTSVWHERESLNKGFWNVGAYSRYLSRDIVFQRDGLNVGELDPDTDTEWGGDLLRSWTYANIYANGKRVIHSELDIYADTGWTDDGYAASLMMLEISDDGGETFRGPHSNTTWGTGEYGRRITFHRLGSSRNRVYRASMTANAKCMVRGTEARMSPVLLPMRSEG